MQWLARPVVTRFDHLVVGLHGGGIPARRNDVVGALVLDQAATSADDLWDLIQPYKVKFAPPHRRRANGSIPVTLRLPSPISLRIDCLVETARERAVVYRHDLIGALIVAAPEDPDLLAAACDHYWQATAGEVARSSGERKRVLSRKTPDPGPRRWRAT